MNRVPTEPTWKGPLSCIGFIAVIAAVFGLLALIRNWAWIDHPVTPALTENDRNVLLRGTLRRGQVAALQETGDMALLREADVAHVLASQCDRASECVDMGRRTCRKVQSIFYCTHRILDRSGSAAVVFIRAYESDGSRPIFQPHENERWHGPRLIADPPDTLIARGQLCMRGYCEPGAMLPWRQTALAAIAADEAKRCKGVEAYVVGQGNTCIDLGNHETRAFRDCRGGFCGPVMVALPRGKFLRGSTSAEIARLEKESSSFAIFHVEHPQREVTIGYDLAIGKFEVTFAEWDACVAGGRCSYAGRPSDAGWGRGPRPVISVSWSDIVREYLPWLNARLGLSGSNGYRLPTDAEWEFAARAGTTTRYAFGDTISGADAQLRDQSTAPAGKTVAAGSFRANAFGLHDMHGNVAEWVHDCGGNVTGHSFTPTDGSADTARDCAQRVVRGGSWDSRPEHVRSASRASVDVNGRYTTVGFRLVRRLAPAR